MGMDEWLNKYPPKDKDSETAGGDGREPVGKRRLKRMPVQRRLDLHGLTAAEARDAVECFITESVRAGCRKVLIIHGKGYHSDGAPVLKAEVYRCLEHHPSAGEFGRAEPKDGGSGAVWVILKQ